MSELKKKLVELAKEEDLDYGLVVAKLPQAWESRPDTSLKLPNNPLLIYKVYADGHEEQVRGLSFKPTTFRVLKDIVMMGDDPTLLNSEQFGQQVSAVAPSTLVKLLELQAARRVRQAADSRDRTWPRSSREARAPAVRGGRRGRFQLLSTKPRRPGLA